MSYDFVIDTFAWMEYFRGTEAGRKVRPFVEGEDSATPAIALAELSRKLAQDVKNDLETSQGRLQRLEFVKSSTQIVALDGDMAVTAGEVDVQRKDTVPGWGLADSIVLVTARSAGAKVVTGDRHFEDLKDEVVFVPRDGRGR